MAAMSCLPHDQQHLGQQCHGHRGGSWATMAGPQDVASPAQRSCVARLHPPCWKLGGNFQDGAATGQSVPGFLAWFNNMQRGQQTSSCNVGGELVATRASLHITWYAAEAKANGRGFLQHLHVII